MTSQENQATIHGVIRRPVNALLITTLALCIIAPTADAAGEGDAHTALLAASRPCQHNVAHTSGRPQPRRCGWTFRDATRKAGLAYEHGFVDGPLFEIDFISGGVAAGDFDADGDIDLYAVTGDGGPNLLFQNRGNGRFREVGDAAGVALRGHRSSGPVFADVDGDGHLDLLVGGTSADSLPVLFLGDGNGHFRDVTATHLPATKPALNAAFGDFDRDGDLDLVLAHWAVTSVGSPTQLPAIEMLWRNDGDGVFEDVSDAAGVTAAFELRQVSDAVVTIVDFTFTPNFADINDDGWPDLLLASDFGTSKVLVNQAGVFVNATSAVISDENGMGAAVADYDNDGDIDWFVSSIYDPDQTTSPGQNWGLTGNRLYRNDGHGNFSDATDEAGVRQGFWGWGSCFADFDNDGHPDLLHVNGFPIDGTAFNDDPTRLFMNRGDGTFAERSAAHGLRDHDQGRGVVCFDADRDGDLDLFIVNNRQPGRFFRNDGDRRNKFLAVRLQGPPGNTQGIGATVWIETRAGVQRRDIRAGSNFVSQDPAEAHFGLARDKRIRRLTIDWPDGEATVISNLRANRRIVVRHPSLGRPTMTSHD